MLKDSVHLDLNLEKKSSSSTSSSEQRCSDILKSVRLKLKPVSSLSGLYAACLEDGNSGGLGRSELVIFSYSTFRNLTREQCHSVCFNESHRYGGLGERHECLCSKNSDPNYISTSQCSAACTNPDVMKVCVKIIALSRLLCSTLLFFLFPLSIIQHSGCPDNFQ